MNVFVCPNVKNWRLYTKKAEALSTEVKSTHRKAFVRMDVPTQENFQAQKFLLGYKRARSE